MTILPKKKQNKNTASNEDERDKDISADRYGYGHSNGNQNTGQMSPNGRTWSTRSEDKRPAPDNGLAPIGSSHSKRRHRNNRVERDADIQRSLINSVRSKNKSSLNSPANSPRTNAENDLAIPGCSNGLVNNEISHPTSILVSVNFGNENNPEEDFSGYNSGDEYQKPVEHFSDSDWEEKERSFERAIRKKGFNIKKMSEDGACLFRAVADQVYGDQEMHTLVRKLCMDYMEKNGDYFSQYVTENFADYIQRKRSDHIHGNHIEIQALSEMYNRPIQVYSYNVEPINVENCPKTDNEPIRLSYHRNSHYNSIVNPYKATIGVGLGLPSFKPGIAEKSIMEKAIRISEQHELEQAMLEDKIRATDWEATNEAIEEQIARESYIEWLRENERRSRTKSSATSTLTNIDDEANVNNGANLSPRCYSPRSSKSCSNDRSSPKRCNNNNNDIIENKPRTPNIDASFLREVPASILGLSDWDDTDPIITQVLAQSQAEYIDSLKRRIPGTSAEESSLDKDTASTDIISLPSTSSKHF